MSVSEEPEPISIPRRAARRLRPLAALGAVLVLCGVGLLVLGRTSASPAKGSADSAADRVAAAAAAGPTQTPCGVVAKGHEATDFLRVAGAHMQDTQGHRIDAYGISLVGGPQGKHWGRTEGSTLAQVTAAAGTWHANVQRLQASEDVMFWYPTRGHAYNVGFVHSVDRLVCAILRAHNIPVLNDNTLFTGNVRAPTAQTLSFWKFFAHRYRGLPVIFDLFNEPRLTRLYVGGPAMSASRVWSIWRDGGVVGGVHYVGMQTIVNAVRNTAHADNVIWVEGAYKSADLVGTAAHPLKGSNLVYAFHKGTPGDGTGWMLNIQRLVDRGMPVVNGEWSQFASTTRPWECFPGAYTAVPRYLGFLRRMSIGLVAWSLQPGALVKGVSGQNTVHDSYYSRFTTDAAQLVAPSVLTRHYACDRANRGQGAGALVLKHFTQLSLPLPAGLFPTFG